GSATALLRIHQCPYRHSTQQCHTARIHHPRRRILADLYQRRGDAELRSVHCIHRRERGGAYTLSLPLEGKGLSPRSHAAARIAICAFMWLNLDIDAKVLGSIWLATGLLVYLLMRITRARR